MISRMLLNIVYFLLCFVPVLLALVYFFQDSLIYFPRAYDDKLLRSIEADKRVIPLVAKTSEGDMTSFYLPPATPSGDFPIWVLFNGNGSLALDWLDYLGKLDRHENGYLLVDYPGYGLNKGKSSVNSMRDAGLAALGALANRLKDDDVAQPSSVTEKAGSNCLPPNFFNRLNILGYSLGAAVGLEVAHFVIMGRNQAGAVNSDRPSIPPLNIVLIAPFTSMLDVARHRYPYLPGFLLKHRFDNVTTLREIENFQPNVYIFHGTDDGVIPVGMSQRLALMFPNIVTYQEENGLHHGDIIDATIPVVRSVIDGK